MISMDLITLNCTLESGENGKLYATITQIFFKNLMTIYHRWNNNRIWRQSTYRDIKEHCPGQASGSWKCAEKQDERSQRPLWCPRTPTLPKDLNTVHPSSLVMLPAGLPTTAFFLMKDSCWVLFTVGKCEVEWQVWEEPAQPLDEGGKPRPCPYRNGMRHYVLDTCHLCQTRRYLGTYQQPPAVPNIA